MDYILNTPAVAETPVSIQNQTPPRQTIFAKSQPQSKMPRESLKIYTHAFFFGELGE
jgi:hypothetical protein